MDFRAEWYFMMNKIFDLENLTLAVVFEMSGFELDAMERRSIFVHQFGKSEKGDYCNVFVLHKMAHPLRN